MPKVYTAVPVPGRADRSRVDSGSVWESVCGFSRAVRIGDRTLISGTTATYGADGIVGAGDVAAQTTFIPDKMAACLSALGSSLADVVRTRIYMRDASQWEAVARVHGRYFAGIQPANTLIGVANLVGDYDVEIEAEAIVD